MKTRNIVKNSFIFLGLAWLVSSCETMVTNVDLPEEKPKLVITTFLSPDEDTIYAFASLSAPYFGPKAQNEPKFISNATIKLTTNGTTHNFLTLPEPGCYYLPKQLFNQPGQTWKLDATEPNGQKVKATCTPPTKKITKVEITNIKYPFNDKPGLISFRFKDIPGEANYYRIVPYSINEDGLGGTYESEISFESGSSLYSDENFDGKYLTFKCSFYDNDPVGFRFRIYTTDKAYYLYHKSVDNFSSDNPFSEATLVYSNVEGGLGVFCSYRKSVIDSILP